MLDFVALFGLIGSLAFFIPSRIDGDELFSFYALGFIIVVSFFIQPVRKITLKMVGMILILALVTTLFDFRVPIRCVFVNLLVGAVAWKAMAERITLTPYRLGRVLIPVQVAQLILVTMQHFRVEKFYNLVYLELAGSYLNPWMMGCLTALMVPFIFLVSPWACILCLPLLILSKSWTCLMVGCLLFGLMLKPSKETIKILVLMLLLALDYLMFFGHDFDQARMIAWKNSFQFIHNPWIGNGLGAWAHEGFLMPNGADHYHWRWAHNEFYQYFFEQGRVGALLMTCLVTSLLFIKNHPIKVVLFGTFILSCAHPIFHFGKSLYYIVLVLAMAVSERGIPWPKTK